MQQAKKKKTVTIDTWAEDGNSDTHCSELFYPLKFLQTNQGTEQLLMSSSAIFS